MATLCLSRKTMSTQYGVQTMKQQIPYHFTLILSGVDDHTEGLEDALFEAGCDDALINFRNGTVYLDFTREAGCFDDAVICAIKDVESSTLPAKVIRMAPDNYVSISDIAKRLAVKRQTISLWVNGARRITQAFPKPIMKLNTKSPLRLCYKIGVGKISRSPRPPNRTCGSPAYGSPVGSSLIGTNTPQHELFPW